MTPESYYDAAAIPLVAPRSVQPITVLELHMFSYLGCLLGLFRGSPAADWGYSYTLTTEGYPYSAELDAAHRTLVAKGLHMVDETAVIRTDLLRARDEFDFVSNAKDWGQRIEWITTATDCALALPVGAIKHAFSQFPSVRSASLLKQRKYLLDQDDIELLHDEFEAVTKILGDHAEDLMAPAVAWLSAQVLREGASIDPA